MIDLFDQGNSGGTGGGPFNDREALSLQNNNSISVSTIKIVSGEYIDFIETFWRHPHGQSASHGGPGGGNQNEIEVLANDYIIAITGTYGSYVNTLNIFLNSGNRMICGGAPGPGNFTYNAPSGFQIVAFRGMSGKYIDAIGVSYAPLPKS